VAVFNELFERRREWLKEDALLVQGKVSDDAYTVVRASPLTK
jgi:hypothetical protein